MPRGGYRVAPCRRSTSTARASGTTRPAAARPCCSCTAASATRGCGSRSSPSSPSGSARSAPTSASSAARPGRRCRGRGRTTSSASSTSSGSSGRRSSGSRSAASSRSTSRSRTPNGCGRSQASRRGSAATTARAYTEEQEARYEAAEAEGDLDAAMEIDLEVWAPLGADERIRQLWHATPDANPLPDGVEPLAPPGAPAKERLGELAVPALVVTVAHDPAGLPRDRPARCGRGAGRAPRRARLRPLRDATRARAPVARAARLPHCGGAAGVGRPPRAARAAADPRSGPRPGKPRARIRDPPAADGDVQPRAPAPPVHGEGPVVVAEGENDVVEPACSLGRSMQYAAPPPCRARARTARRTASDRACTPSGRWRSSSASWRSRPSSFSSSERSAIFPGSSRFVRRS